MITYFDTSELRKKFKTRSIVIGTLLVIAGIFSIIVPQVTSFTLSVMLGLLFIFGSVISAFHVKQSYNKSWLAWLRPVIYLIVGILILRNPLTGVAAIGFTLMFYFFMSGFAQIFLGFEFKPITGWFWLVLNGFISIVLALFFLLGWPITSIWLIGLLVGISFLTDGISLIMLGISLPKYSF